MAGLARTRAVRAGGARHRSAGRSLREGLERAGLRPLTTAGLVFLRGPAADARLRALERERARVRPLLGALAAAWVDRRAHEELGFRGLGDWSRERLGVGARAVQEWARVAKALAALPRLRAAVLAGEVSWTVAGRILELACPDTDAACVQAVRGRTVRAVEALVRAVRAASPSEEEPGGSGDRVRVWVPCTARVHGRWAAAVELARRVAGEALPTWEAAEAIAAEGASARGAPERAAAAVCRAGRSAAAPEDESGLRAVVWPHLSWRLPAGRGGDDVPGLDLAGCSPRELDARFRAAVAFLQRVDFEMGRLLREVVDRRLHRELGFATFERFVRERLEVSPRTVRRLVRLARAEHQRPALATAFREGRITLLQAEALLRGRVSVAFAKRVTLRRLEAEVGEAGAVGGAGELAAIAFSAPRDVAALFKGMVARMGLEALLDHAIATWTAVGRQFDDYADFERDGYRCTVPACTARRNLQSHHIRFRSAGGPDVAWNRTTLCAFHHHRGVHAGRVRISGRAPDKLLFELGIGRFRSGDVAID